jgi:hypothetical protein
MLRIARSLRVPVCLVGFLVALPLLTIAPELLDGSGCARISGWVTTHQTTLPQTYGELLTYPVAYREEILAALPGSHRASIMVAHLKWLTSSEPSLTHLLHFARVLST